jgi:hypothetical protein
MSEAMIKALLGGERPKFGEKGYKYKPFLRNRLIEPKVEGKPRDEDHPDVVLEGNPLTGNYQYRNNPRPKRGGGGW